MEDFENAVKAISDSNLTLDNNTMLTLYGYYKQVTCGDCNINQPSILDPRGRAKYTAWNDNKGLEQNKAIKRYVKLVERILSS